MTIEMILQELRDRVAELERRHANMLRFGAIDSISGDEIVVKYSDDRLSRPMPLASISSAFSADPTVGDQVIVLSPDGEQATQIAVHGVSTTDKAKGNKTPPARSDVVNQAFSDIVSAINEVANGGGADLTGVNTSFTSAPDSAANKVQVD